MDLSSIVINSLILLVSAVVITKSIGIFIDSSTKLAHVWGLSEYTISFLLISAATSFPELVVAITSALEKNSILSYGDAIGSNLALLTLVVAIPIIFGHKLSTKGILHNRDIYYSGFFLILALGMALDGTITRGDGIILLIGYFVYSRAVLKRANIIETIVDKIEHANPWKEGVLFLFSLALLILASEGIVKTAINLSGGLGISLGYVGLTITALGTSLPEIAFVIGVLRANAHKDEILGDIIGSVVANSTLVLGTAAMIFPIELGHSSLGLPTILVLFSTLLLFIAFAKSDENLDKKEAAILLVVYAIFIGVEYALVI